MRPLIHHIGHGVGIIMGYGLGTMHIEGLSGLNKESGIREPGSCAWIISIYIIAINMHAVLCL